LVLLWLKAVRAGDRKTGCAIPPNASLLDNEIAKTAGNKPRSVTSSRLTGRRFARTADRLFLNVRFRGSSGHGPFQCKCPLM